ncbi:uncharacterized protein V6R79_005205 [Siganus canaliculatus]
MHLTPQRHLELSRSVDLQAGEQNQRMKISGSACDGPEEDPPHHHHPGLHWKHGEEDDDDEDVHVTDAEPERTQGSSTCRDGAAALIGAGLRSVSCSNTLKYDSSYQLNVSYPALLLLLGETRRGDALKEHHK